MIRPLSWTRPCASSSAVIRSGATRLTSSTEFQRSSSMLASCLSRVMPALCTTTSTPPWPVGEVLGDPLRGVLGGDVEGEVVAAELLGQRDQVAGRLRHVHPDDGRAVAGEHPGDLLADAAGRPGDEGDLAGQRTLPVGLLGAASVADVPIRTTWPETYADFGESRNAERRRGRALGAGGDVDQLDGAAAADLLAEAAGEALERALRDPLLARRPAPGACRGRRAASSASRLRISGCEEVAQRDQGGRVGQPGRVEDQRPGSACPPRWPSTVAMSRVSRMPGRCSTSRPAPPTTTVPSTSGDPAT